MGLKSLSSLTFTYYNVSLSLSLITTCDVH